MTERDILLWLIGSWVGIPSAIVGGVSLLLRWDFLKTDNQAGMAALLLGGAIAAVVIISYIKLLRIHAQP